MAGIQFGRIVSFSLTCSAVILLARTQIIHKFTKDHCGTVPFPSDGVFCVFVVFRWFCWRMGHTNAQMRKCTDGCSCPIDWSSNPWLLSLKLHMVVAQLFEVTVAADGSELSSKRVSKLSRRYHRHKKQLRQSAMMAEAGRGVV